MQMSPRRSPKKNPAFQEIDVPGKGVFQQTHPKPTQPTESHQTHPSQSHYWILHTDARYGVVSLVAITTSISSPIFSA